MVKCNIDIDTCCSESDIEEVVITFRPTPRKTKLINSKEFYEKHRIIQEHIANVDLSKKQIPGRHRYWPSKDPNNVGIKNQTSQLKTSETTKKANGFPTTVISFDSDEFVDAEPNTLKKDKTIAKVKAEPKFRQFSTDSFELLTKKYKISIKHCKDKRDRKKQRFHCKAPIKKQGTFAAKSPKVRKNGDINILQTPIDDPFLQANTNLTFINPKEKTLQGYQLPDYLPAYFKIPKEEKTENISHKCYTKKIIKKEEKSLHAFATKQTQTLFKSGIERRKHKGSAHAHAGKEHTSIKNAVKEKEQSNKCKIHKKNRDPRDEVQIKKKEDSIKCEKDETKSKHPEVQEIKKEIFSIKTSFGEKKRDHSTDKESKREQKSFECEIGEEKPDLPCDAEVKKEKISNKSEMDVVTKKLSRNAQVKKKQIPNECKIEENKRNRPYGSQINIDQTLIAESNGEGQSPSDEKSELNKLIVSENDNKIDVYEANSTYTHLTQQMEAVVERVEILSSEVKTTNVKLSAILTELQDHHGIVSSVAEISIDHPMESELEMSSISSTLFEDVWQKVFTRDVAADVDNKETISKHASLEKVINFVLTETPTAANLDDKLVEKNLSREKTINFATIKELTNSEQPISTTNNLFTSKDSEKGCEYNRLTEATIKLTAIQTSGVMEPDAAEPELSHNINKLSLSKKSVNEKKMQLDDKLISSDSDSNAIEIIKAPPLSTHPQNMSTKKKSNINQISEIKNTSPNSSSMHESSYVESDMLHPPKFVHLKKLGSNGENRRAFIFTVEDLNTNRHGNKPFLELEKLTTDTESYEEKYLDKPKKLPVIRKLNTSQTIKPSVLHHPTKVYTEQRKAKVENIRTNNKSHQGGAEKERTHSSISRLEHLITSMVFTVRDYVKFLHGTARKPKQDKPTPQTSSSTSDYVINSKKRANSRVPHNSLASSLSDSNKNKKMKQHKSSESVNLSMSSDDSLSDKKKENKKHRVFRSSSEISQIAKKEKKHDDQISSFTFSSTTSSHVNDNIHNVSTSNAITQTSVPKIVPEVNNSVLPTNETTTNPCQKKKVNFVKEDTVTPVPCTCIIQERLVYPASSSGSEVEIPTYKSNKEAENLKKYFDHADELQPTSDTSESESVEREEVGHCNRDVQTTFSHIYSNLKETCLYCTNGYLPVYDERIIHVIYKFIKEYDPKDIGIIVNIANNNLFHIKIILMSSGRSISCFYSTINGLQEAKKSGIMDHFPVYFV
ncbi:uncharacterized protein LOC119676272 [Teleopsis dalmanni]|uniref:uncharacterized protein LOC119676272 n=1 Tax=Teleopsis dalmanni TaxID=139649 RepID=UPI0018CCCBFB|nr:uncharacterized protein LOC119676272 [Teleopsis dalmanni]